MFKLVGTHDFIFQTRCPVHFFGKEPKFEGTSIYNIIITNCTCRKRTCSLKEVEDIAMLGTDWCFSHNKKTCRFCK